MEPYLGLFANGREANITSAIAMVEGVLLELGHFVNDCREEPPCYGQRSWTVRKGSALVRIALLRRDDDDVHLRTEAVVMTLTEGVDEALLFRRLLSINSEISGAAFALADDHVLLLAERSTLDLDRSEVLDLIHRTETYADHYDDMLIAEFGGVLGTG